MAVASGDNIHIEIFKEKKKHWKYHFKHIENRFGEHLKFMVSKNDQKNCFFVNIVEDKLNCNKKDNADLLATSQTFI